MAFHRSMDWHSGEKQIHKLTHNMREDNPTSPFLTPRAAAMCQRYSLMSLGTLDSEDQPWCTVWGTGEPPLAQQVAPSILGIRSTVDGTFDPVVEALFGDKADGEVVREQGEGRMVSGLSIELEERGRIKLYGRMVAGALNAKLPLDSVDGIDSGTQKDGSAGQPAEAQLVLKIEQSLGNCPKYLNRKKITSAIPEPKLLSTSPHLSDEAIDLIHNADLFFVASAHEHEDMDSNHRGGPQGFIRVHNPPENAAEGEEPAKASGSVIVWPEYSGNNLYQTLGNLVSTPRAGLCIPDFSSGDVLYLTGTTEVLIGNDAANVIAKSKLAVKFTVTGSRHVSRGLPFRGTNIDDTAQGRSPYNPRVRYLTTEKQDELAGTTAKGAQVTAHLVRKTPLTPTITRYRFALSDPGVYGPWKPGQYVALDFSGELDLGYSHMRDDDPTSLNDDYLRTFTVSSIPGSLGVHGEEFEMTVRKVGSVTGFLGWQREGGLEVGVVGFGGEFKFDFEGGGSEGRKEKVKNVGFIAAGIGITPLLGQMGMPELADIMISERVRVLWSLGILDANLALDIVQTFPQLKDVMTIFLTGDEKILLDDNQDHNHDQHHDHKKHKHTKKQKPSQPNPLTQLTNLGITIHRRRLQKTDVQETDKEVDEWYLCTAPGLRKEVQGWIPGRAVVFENFDY